MNAPDDARTGVEDSLAEIERLRHLADERDRELQAAVAELARLRRRPEVRVANRVRRLLKPTAGRKPTAPGADPATASSGDGAGAAPGGATARTEPRSAERFRHLVDPLLGDPRNAAFGAAFAASEEELAKVPRLSSGPLVSVVMPTFNRADIIRDAIDSLREQSYPDWELLVADDASTDATEDVVRSYGDPRIRYEVVAKGGAARARNSALGRAAGDVIAYLDSDNVWHPDFLAVMVAALAENPGRHTAYCRYVDVRVASDGLRLRSWASLPFDYDALPKGNFIDLNGFVHRRALYETFGGFNVDLVRFQDWDLVLKYAFPADPVYVDQFLMLYRRNVKWNQITDVHKQDRRPAAMVRQAVVEYYEHGLPEPSRDQPSVVVFAGSEVSARARMLTDVLGDRVRTPNVREGADPGDYPGDVLLAMTSHPSSLGRALLHNARSGRPILLDCADQSQRPESATVGLNAVDPADPRLRDQDGELWASLMGGVARRLPHVTYARPGEVPPWAAAAYLVRDSPGDNLLDPDGSDRSGIRAEWGLPAADVVVLWATPPEEELDRELVASVCAARAHHRVLVIDWSLASPARVPHPALGDRVDTVGAPTARDLVRLVGAADAVVVPPSTGRRVGPVEELVTAALALSTPLVVGEERVLGVNDPRSFAAVTPSWDPGSVIAGVVGPALDPARTGERSARARRLYDRQFCRAGLRSVLGLAIADAALRPGVLEVAVEYAGFCERLRSV
jgi:hypothetical protein